MRDRDRKRERSEKRTGKAKVEEDIDVYGRQGLFTQLHTQNTVHNNNKYTTETNKQKTLGKKSNVAQLTFLINIFKDFLDASKNL